MWWKLYFWIIAILMGLSLFVGVDYYKLTFIDWVGLLVSVPSLIGLFVYVYNKNKFLSIKAWQVVFWLTIVMDGIWLVLASTPVKDVLPLFLRPQATNYNNATEAIIGIVLELPILYALYQLAFNLNWYSKEEVKRVNNISLVNPIKSVWWKVASISLVIYGFIYLFSLVSDTSLIINTYPEVKIATAIIGLLQIFIGVFLWYRVSLALLLSAIYFIFRAMALLGGGLYGEFIFNTIMLFILFILILKTYTKITQS